MRSNELRKSSPNMRFSVRFRYVAWIGALAINAHLVWSQEPVDTELAIAAIHAAESEIRNLEWNVSVREGALSDVNGVWSLVDEKPYRFEGLIRVDRQSDRYFADLSVVQPAVSTSKVGPATGLLEGTSSSSFDGEIFRQWSRSGIASETQAAVEVYGSGVIDRDASRLNDATFEKAYGSAAGLAWMPPTAYVDPDRELLVPSLATFLRSQGEKNEPVEVTQSGSVWRIKTGSSKPADAYPITTDIFWDIDKNAVTEQLWYYDMPEGPEVLQHARIRLQAYEAFWVPAEVFFYEPVTRNHRAVRWTFRNVVVNRQLAPSDFVASFPPDIQLTDYIEGKHYLTGSSTIDEQAAIQSFMKRTGAEAPAGTGGPTMMGWLIGLCLLGFAILLVAIGYKRFRGAKVAMAAAIASLAFAESTQADEPRGSIVSHSRGERILVTRCGFRACVAALEYFHVDAEMALVDDSLVPYWDGVRLSDIAHVLEGYGLKVRLRKNVSAAEIGDAVSRSRIAIVPVHQKNGWNHYVLCVVNGAGERRVLDPPHGDMPFDGAFNDEALVATRGAVAFVEKAEARPAEDGVRLSIHPKTVEFDQFLAEGPSADAVLKKEFTVKNAGATAVMVTEFRSSCGCARPDWRGGLIRPGESQAVMLVLHPVAWGLGPQKKAIALVEAGGRETFIDIQGDGLSLEKYHGLSVSRRAIEITEKELREKGASLAVSGSPKALEKLALESTAPWLTLQAESTAEESRRVHFALGSDAVLPAGDSDWSDATVYLRTRSDGPPIETSLRILRHRSAEMRPSALTFRAGDSTSQSAEIFALSEATSIRSVSDVSSNPDGLTVELSDESSDGARSSLRVSLPEGGAASSVYLVTCRVELSNGAREDLRLVVRVKE